MLISTDSRGLASDGGHVPVLLAEVVRWLVERPGGLYVDATLGSGGHARGLLGAGAARVIGFDRDRSALDAAREALGADAARVDFVHADFRTMPAVLADRGVTAVDGIVADLGVSSRQLDDPGRGLSFRRAGPLDMRLDQSAGATLAERLEGVDESELADVIWRYGEERHSRRVARAIVAAVRRGALTDTAALAAVVRRAAGGGSWQRIDPATRTFQALRIWTNDELEGLDRFVAAGADLLAVGGRFAIIAFHSLEDRVVKHGFRQLGLPGGRFVVRTKRPIVPTAEESDANSRARSARLRVLERVA
jgi:16S rRNA (cytosine1402-N4)-methyltransferase